LTNKGFKLFFNKEDVIRKVIYKRAKEQMKEDNDTVTEPAPLALCNVTLLHRGGMIIYSIMGLPHRMYNYSIWGQACPVE